MLCPRNGHVCLHISNHASCDHLPSVSHTHSVVHMALFSSLLMTKAKAIIQKNQYALCVSLLFTFPLTHISFFFFLGRGGVSRERIYLSRADGIQKNITRLFDNNSVPYICLTDSGLPTSSILLARLSCFSSEMLATWESSLVNIQIGLTDIIAIK